MQTNLRGRDLIGDLDFSKEEVETVLDVAFDLKRKRALGEPHAYLRDKVLAMLVLLLHTGPHVPVGSARIPDRPGDDRRPAVGCTVPCAASPGGRRRG